MDYPLSRVIYSTKQQAIAPQQRQSLLLLLTPCSPFFSLLIRFYVKIDDEQLFKFSGYVIPLVVTIGISFLGVLGFMVGPLDAVEELHLLSSLL